MQRVFGVINWCNYHNSNQFHLYTRRINFSMPQIYRLPAHQWRCLPLLLPPDVHNYYLSTAVAFEFMINCWLFHFIEIMLRFILFIYLAMELYTKTDSIWIIFAKLSHVYEIRINYGLPDIDMINWICLGYRIWIKFISEFTYPKSDTIRQQQKYHEHSVSLLLYTMKKWIQFIRQRRELFTKCAMCFHSESSTAAHQKTHVSCHLWAELLSLTF